MDKRVQELENRLQDAEKMLSLFLSGEIGYRCLYCVHYRNPEAPCYIWWNDDKDWCKNNAAWNGKLSPVCGQLLEWEE